MSVAQKIRSYRVYLKNALIRASDTFFVLHGDRLQTRLNGVRLPVSTAGTRNYFPHYARGSHGKDDYKEALGKAK